MNDTADICLSLLLFSVGGVNFGIDSEYVTEVNAYDGEQCADLSWFHEVLEYGCVAANYLSPTVVSISGGGIKPYRVIIDRMEDIAEFSLNNIHQFPELLEPFAIRRGLWGILPWKGNVVLLLDFQLLLKYKPN